MKCRGGVARLTMGRLTVRGRIVRVGERVTRRVPGSVLRLRTFGACGSGGSLVLLPREGECGANRGAVRAWSRELGCASGGCYARGDGHDQAHVARYAHGDYFRSGSVAND